MSVKGTDFSAERGAPIQPHRSTLSRNSRTIRSAVFLPIAGNTGESLRHRRIESHWSGQERPSPESTVMRQLRADAADGDEFLEQHLLFVA